FVGDTIELIAHAQGEREVASHFPCVLYVPVVLMLAKVLIVRTLTRPGFVEEFGIKIIVDDTVKSLRSLLECRVVGRDSLHNGNTKTAQQAIDCHLAAGKEAVWPLLGYVPEVPAKLQCMRTVDPANAIAVASCSSLTPLTVGDERQAPKTRKRTHVDVPTVPKTINRRNRTV